jgi:hypothetical protein
MTSALAEPGKGQDRTAADRIGDPIGQFGTTAMLASIRNSSNSCSADSMSSPRLRAR